MLRHAVPRCAVLRCAAAARVVGATMMWGLSGKLKKKYKVEGDVREALYKVGPRCARWARCVMLCALACCGMLRCG